MIVHRDINFPEFASLLTDMWSSKHDTVFPNKFKSTVAKSAPRFVGYRYNRPAHSVAHAASCAVVQQLTILLTKTTAVQNDVALSYHRVRGLYFLEVVFVRSIVCCIYCLPCYIYIGYTWVDVHLYIAYIVYRAIYIYRLYMG